MRHPVHFFDRKLRRTSLHDLLQRLAGHDGVNQVTTQAVRHSAQLTKRDALIRLGLFRLMHRGPCDTQTRCLLALSHAESLADFLQPPARR